MLKKRKLPRNIDGAIGGEGTGSRQTKAKNTSKLDSRSVAESAHCVPVPKLGITATTTDFTLASSNTNSVVSGQDGNHADHDGDSDGTSDSDIETNISIRSKLNEAEKLIQESLVLIRKKHKTIQKKSRSKTSEFEALEKTYNDVSMDFEKLEELSQAVFRADSHIREMKTKANRMDDDMEDMIYRLESHRDRTWGDDIDSIII